MFEDPETPEDDTWGDEHDYTQDEEEDQPNLSEPADEDEDPW